MADHLLQEVDADVRAENLHQLWRDYRSKLLFLVVAILVATAGSTVWKSYQEKRGAVLMTALSEAQTLYTQGKFADAAAAFETAASTTSGDTKTLAQLWQGRALAAADKKPEAIAVLQTASAAAPSLWSDLACLRLAGLDAAAATCLAAAKDSPLASQRRALAAASDWSAGKKAQAIATLEELATSDDTTESMRNQVMQWLATLRASEPAGE